MYDNWRYQSIDKALCGLRRLFPEKRYGVLRGGEFDWEVIDDPNLEYVVKANTSDIPNTNTIGTTLHLYWKVCEYPYYSLYKYVWRMNYEYDRRMMSKSDFIFNTMVRKCVRQYKQWESEKGGKNGADFTE